MKIIEAVEPHLVEDWRNWWKRWSVKLAAAIGVLSTLLVANQSFALSLLNALPAGGFARILVAVCVGIVVFVVPTLAVLLRQDKPDAPR